MMTVVKADGYGHGLVESARAARAGGADWLRWPVGRGAGCAPGLVEPAGAAGAGGGAGLGVGVLEGPRALGAAGAPGPLLPGRGVRGEDFAPAVQLGVDVTAYTVEELA